MRASLFLIGLLMSSAACSKVDDFGEAVGVDPQATASAEANAVGAEGEARAVSEENALYQFEYSYPAEAGAYPVLKTYLDADLAEIKAGLIRDAKQWKAEAESQGYPYNRYVASNEWKLVTDIPGWLSLSDHTWGYAGGAHGMYGIESLLFDKRARTIREPLDLFASPEAFWDAVDERYCAKLDRQREERRGAPVDKSDPIFGACPDIDQLTLLLGSSNGETFDRMTLYAGPYVAGSYAEGGFETDLDIDAAVLGAVKPEFVDDFSARR